MPEVKHSSVFSVAPRHLAHCDIPTLTGNMCASIHIDLWSQKQVAEEGNLDTCLWHFYGKICITQFISFYEIGLALKKKRFASSMSELSINV